MLRSISTERNTKLFFVENRLGSATVRNLLSQFVLLSNRAMILFFRKRNFDERWFLEMGYTDLAELAKEEGYQWESV